MKKVKIRVNLKTSPRSKKPRRPRGELVRCYKCPTEHPGWKRSDLRNRRNVSFCPEHLAEYDAVNQTWPRCPRCGSDFGVMKWGGDVLSTTAFCSECDFSTPAHKYFDALTILTIAKPIER